MRANVKSLYSLLSDEDEALLNEMKQLRESALAEQQQKGGRGMTQKEPPQILKNSIRTTTNTAFSTDSAKIQNNSVNTKEFIDFSGANSTTVGWLYKLGRAGD